jgi:hypothetical protein
VRAIFTDMSALADRINALRAQAMAASAKLDAGSALHKRLGALDESADTIRKKIVATKEGGAITGEERLREHTDSLYGAIMSYDGKPTDYQLARIESLKRELGNIEKEFADLQAGDLAKVNVGLKKAGMSEIDVANAAGSGGSGGPASTEQLRAIWMHR